MFLPQRFRREPQRRRPYSGIIVFNIPDELCLLPIAARSFLWSSKASLSCSEKSTSTNRTP
jgi:hypothetical protein